MGQSRRFFALLLGGILIAGSAAAMDYTSPSFILRDPVVTIGGTYATSLNFQYFSSSGQNAIGLSESESFEARAGFLYFPVATTPVAATTAGDAEVDVAWTASVGTHGNVTSYQVGTALVSGGPYIYENVGNVLNFTVTGLTNGIEYFFRVRALAGGEVVARSAEVSAIPEAVALPPSLPPSGGGLVSGPGVMSRAIFSGWASPGATVLLLQDGLAAREVIVGTDATFVVETANLTPGRYTFGLGFEDQAHRRSRLVVFLIEVVAGRLTRLSSIVLPPTIEIDKVQVKAGEPLFVTGATAPGAAVQVILLSDGTVIRTDETVALANGSYRYELDTASLTTGVYRVEVTASFGGITSRESLAIPFVVGEVTILVPPGLGCRGPADFNCDGRVNLIDFSILIFWIAQSPPSTIDLSADGTINLTDVSILVYYWTG